MATGLKETAEQESESLQPGNMLGSYRIIECLGEGGMGRVYHAEHEKLGRSVALKVLRKKYSNKRELVSRFFAEARSANQIEHENIVEITDFVEDKDLGLYYIVMERLRGFDLLNLIASKGALPPNQAVDIGLQVTSAVAAAHESGIVHRDLKPDNVFLIERTGRKDFVKLLDFGIAKLQQDQDEDEIGISVHQTSPGSMIGTPTYMSPEQSCGRVVDHRSDIYSFGVILYEMVTGKVPFEGHSFGELVVKHTVMAPPRPTQQEDLVYPVHPRLEAIILKCLEKEVEDRPQSMLEVNTELMALSEELATTKPEPETTSFSEKSVPIEICELEEPEDAAIAAEREPELKTEKTGRGGLIIGLATGAGLAVGIAVAIVFALSGDDAPVVEHLPSTGHEPQGPALPTTVTLEFSSTPPGALVYDQLNGPPLGTTPLKKTFTRADRRQHFTIKLAGFMAVEADISLARDGQLAVNLHPETEQAALPGASDTTEQSPNASGPPDAAKVSKSRSSRSRGTSRSSKRSEKRRERPEKRPVKTTNQRPTESSRRAVLDPFAD